MSKLFWGKFMALLNKKEIPLDRDVVNTLYKKNWVVYAKRPFASPHSVVEYLGRYTHKIAISNNRILSIDDQKVTFGYNDYRHGGRKKQMSLNAEEFIRRFALHILPKGFVRIRHFGFLSSTAKKESIALIRGLLPQRVKTRVEPRKLQKFNPLLCPCCKTETMVTIELLPKRGPPKIAELSKLLSQNKSRSILAWQRYALSEEKRENTSEKHLRKVRGFIRRL
ncbi:transposase [Pedobacter sp. SYSU D00535]|uniref:IS91 family transposase n=1 Tax=Pedobacter sp. SYSU D00535 TaxID=2810308 RepID=UPI001F61EED6|nr:transposase [Pedobacter sp. SYSU D00535]